MNSSWHENISTWHDELIPDKTHIVISLLSCSGSCVQAALHCRGVSSVMTETCHDVTDLGPYLVSWPLSSVSSPIVRSFLLLLSSIFPSQISDLDTLSSHNLNRLLPTFKIELFNKVFNWYGAHYISWSSFEILLQNFDSPCYTNFLMGTFSSPGWAGGLAWLHWQQYLLISSKSETPR